jgi:hypothetical protein
MKRRWPSLRDGAWLALLAAGAFAVRAWRLSDLAPDMDDVLHYYLAMKAGSLADCVRSAAGNPMHALLDPLLAFVFAKLGGSPDALRLPALLFGAGSAVLVQRLGKRLGAPRAGWIAAVLLACSANNVLWSRRIDFYSALVFMSLLSVLVLLDAVEKPRPSAFVRYAAVQALFAYTHPYAFVVLAVQGAWVLAFRREALRSWSAAAAAATAAWLPWLVLAMKPFLGAGKLAWRGAGTWPQGFGVVAPVLRSWAQSPDESNYLFTPDMWRLEGVCAWVYFVLFAGGLALIARRKAWRTGWGLAALLLPLGLALVSGLDRAFSYFFAPRQMLFAAPFYLLIASKGLDEAWGSKERWLRGTAAGSGLFVLLVFAVVLIADHRAEGDGYRRRLAQMDQLRASLMPGDSILLRETETAQVFLFDYDRRALLGLPPPLFHGGTLKLGIPDGLMVGSGDSKNPAYCLMNPESEAERTARWRELAAKIAGRPAFYFQFFIQDDALRRFTAETGLARALSR